MHFFLGALRVRNVLKFLHLCINIEFFPAFHQTSNLSLANKLNNEVSMPVAANETVGIGESQSTLTDTHTVMILQEDGSLTTLSEAYQTQVTIRSTTNNLHQTTISNFSAFSKIANKA